MANTITVSTLNGLYQALSTATGGETILLAGGNYGDFALTQQSGFDVTFPSNVTIASANPANPAVFSGLDVRQAANLTFDGVVFDYSFGAGDKLSNAAFSVADSANITIRNSSFDGDVARGVSATDDGYGYGVGLLVRGSTGVAVEGNEFSNFFRGLVVMSSSDTTVTQNDISAIRKDGMNFAGVTGVLIEDNTLRDFRRSPNSNDHSDMIQFWTMNTDTPSTDIIIRSNRLDIGLGDANQSIYMRNDAVDSGRAGPEMFYRNVLIEDNLIVNGQLHGITVGATAGLTIRDNSVLRSDGKVPDGADSPVEIPRINIASNSTGVVVTGNVTPSINGWSNQPGWTVSGNAFVQDQNPDAPGYYGDVFISSSLQPVNGVNDFIILPGGMIDRLGAGSSLSQPDPGSNEPIAQFKITDDPTNGAARIFDASLSTAGAGALPAGTVYIWNFGDGTTARGAVVSHSYADGGNYNVTLTVTQPGGLTDSQTLKLPVNGPEVLSLGANGGFIAYENGTQTVFDVPPAGSAAGIQLGARGVTATVARQNVVDIVGANEFTIDMSLKADTAGAWGEVFRLNGSLTASINGNGALEVKAFPDDASPFTLTSRNLRLNDRAEYDVSIRLDDGKLQIWVDGRLSAQADMPGPLGSRGAADLVFGNPWGQKNFGGDLTGFEIRVNEDDYPATPTTEVISTAAPANPFRAAASEIFVVSEAMAVVSTVQQDSRAPQVTDTTPAPVQDAGQSNYDAPLHLGDRFEFLDGQPLAPYGHII